MNLTSLEIDLYAEIATLTAQLKVHRAARRCRYCAHLSRIWFCENEDCPMNGKPCPLDWGCELHEEAE